MIKVSDVDKYSHSQFISSCLAWGCRRQHPRLITSEAWGMMLGGGGGGVGWGVEDDAAAWSWPVYNPKLASWYSACPPVVVKHCEAGKWKTRLPQASLRACNAHYTAGNEMTGQLKNGDSLVILGSLPPEGQTFSTQHCITSVAFEHAKISTLTCGGVQQGSMPQLVKLMIPC